MSAIKVTVADAKGSTPRDAGTSMLVRADRIDGTIGGGALEWHAMGVAREMLARGDAHAVRSVPLGPHLGQCCGGAVTLVFEAAASLEHPEGRPVWVWGAGHVGRALTAVLAPMEQLAVTWIDTREDRFPAEIPPHASLLVAAEPSLLMQRAPLESEHFIATYSHDIDLALCHAALRRGVVRCGLIGSATKWARFQTRLRALGHADAEIERIRCPIGDPSLGKRPHEIAIGVAARLLSRDD